MIKIKTVSVQDAIQMVEGLEKVDGGVVSYDCLHNQCTHEIAIFKDWNNGFILVSMDVAFPNDNPLVIEHRDQLLMLPSKCAEICSAYSCDITSVLPMTNPVMTAAALFLIGENE